MNPNAIGMMGLGAVFLVVAAYSFYTGSVQAANWVKSKGTVTKTFFDGFVATGPRAVVVYHASIAYSYSFEGKKYDGIFNESNGYSQIAKQQYEEFIKTDPSLAQHLTEDSQYQLRKKLVEGYPKGSSIDIRVNPANPQESRIEQFYTQNQSIIPILLGVFGALLLVGGFLTR